MSDSFDGEDIDDLGNTVGSFSELISASADQATVYYGPTEPVVNSLLDLFGIDPEEVPETTILKAQEIVRDYGASTIEGLVSIIQSNIPYVEPFDIGLNTSAGFEQGAAEYDGIEGNTVFNEAHQTGEIPGDL